MDFSGFDCLLAFFQLAFISIWFHPARLNAAILALVPILDEWSIWILFWVNRSFWFLRLFESNNLWSSLSFYVAEMLNLMKTSSKPTKASWFIQLKLLRQFWPLCEQKEKMWIKMKKQNYWYVLNFTSCSLIFFLGPFTCLLIWINESTIQMYSSHRDTHLDDNEKNKSTDIYVLKLLRKLDNQNKT